MPRVPSAGLHAGSGSAAASAGGSDMGTGCLRVALAGARGQSLFDSNAEALRRKERRRRARPGAPATVAPSWKAPSTAEVPRPVSERWEQDLRMHQAERRAVRNKTERVPGAAREEEPLGLDEVLASVPWAAPLLLLAVPLLLSAPLLLACLVALVVLVPRVQEELAPPLLDLAHALRRLAKTPMYETRAKGPRWEQTEGWASSQTDEDREEAWADKRGRDMDPQSRFTEASTSRSADAAEDSGSQSQDPSRREHKARQPRASWEYAPWNYSDSVRSGRGVPHDIT